MSDNVTVTSTTTTGPRPCQNLCHIDAIPGGCSTGFGTQFLKSTDISRAECEARCLEMDNCVIFQSHSSQQCWFYDQPDTNGPNGGEPEADWACGVKNCTESEGMWPGLVYEDTTNDRFQYI